MDNKSNEQRVNVLAPDDAVFAGRPAVESVIPSGLQVHVFDHVEYPDTGGIYIYYKGQPYPKKGFPTPEAVWSNDICKRLTMTVIRSLGGKDMILPVLAFAILPWSIKRRVIIRAMENYARTCDWLLQGHYLQPNRYTPACRSINLFVGAFLRSAGLTDKFKSEDSIARIISTMIEYDDSYRYRIEDVMSEASHTALIERPVREVRRLAAIFMKREDNNMKGIGDTKVVDTGRNLAFLASLVLLHPKIKKAWRTAWAFLSPDEFSDMQMDNADRYHTLQRGDYDYGGLDTKQRRNILIDFHTFSKCCRAGVFETRINPVDDKDQGWKTHCRKCKKECEWVQEFPPMVELSNVKMQRQ